MVVECYALAMLKTSIARAFLLLFLTLLVPKPSMAAEGGWGAYLPGYGNFQTGIVPSKPGWYLRNDVLFYTASAPRVPLNGLPIENASIDAVADIVQPSYVFPWKLFGANHAFVLYQPFVWAEQSGRISGTDLEPSGSRFAHADTAISPLYLGWHKGSLHYNTNLAIFIPTGDYDINRVVNTSKNYWTIDPEFGITYLNPKTGWELTGAIGYSINTENPATDYKSGDALHLDYTIGRASRYGVKPAIVGYAWVQVTDDTGPGAIFGPFKSRVFGFGPAVQWRAKSGEDFSFRYYHEFGAKDHLEGDQFAFSYRVSF